MRSLSIAALFVFVVASISVPAAAAPVRYNFTTGPQLPFGPPDVLGKFAGPVTGSIVYDAAVPLSGQGPSTAFGFLFASLYNSAIVSLDGAVDGRAFSDTAGGNVVTSNDAYVLSPPPPPAVTAPPTDIFLLLADPFQIGPAFPHTLSGFDIGGLRLVNIRMFWNETLLGAPDFLNNDALLADLPSFEGRLVLDFVPISPIGAPPTVPTTFAFFDGLRVTRATVPAPQTLPLLGGALLALLAVRRSKARRQPARRS